MLRITAYADRLIDDLELVDWPEHIKKMQRRLDRPLRRCARVLPARRITRASGSRSSPRGPTRCSARPTWCSRPSTRSSRQITTPAQRAAVAALRRRRRAQERARAHGRREDEDGRRHRRVRDQPGERRAHSRSGSPTTCSRRYGTGAIMAVPGHDARDYAFARAFGLPIVEVVSGGDVAREAYEGDGRRGELRLPRRAADRARPRRR